MSSTFNLTLGERLAATRIFDDGYKGTISGVAKVFEDVKALVISEEEWQKADLKKVAKPDGGEVWNWNEDKVLKDVTLSDEGVTYLKEVIHTKDEKKQVQLSDKALISLYNKISN